MVRFLVCFSLLFVTACGVLDDDPHRRTLAAGYTPCNDAPNPESGVVCHPNQYCADQKRNWCFQGCLSDDNCSLEQICVKKPSFSTGDCMAIDDLPEESPELEPGYTECGDSSLPSNYSICHPSQYCYSHRYGDCSSGCLSELNCTGRQDCIKEPGENTGVCMSSP